MPPAGHLVARPDPWRAGSVRAAGTPLAVTPLAVTLLGVLACALLPAAACQHQVSQGACEFDSDCAAGERCEAAACVSGAQCSETLPCPGGAPCVAGLCPDVPAADGGPPPANDGGGGGGVVVPGLGVARVMPGLEVDFGSPVYGVGIEKVISVLNVGTGPLQLLAISRSDGTSEEFAWSTEVTLPAALEVGDRIEVALVYTLADGEDDTGSIYLRTDGRACEPACADPERIEVGLYSEFKGARNLTLEPAEHDFGYVPVGDQSAARTLLLTNQGTLDKVLTVTRLVASGDVSHFSFTLPAAPLYIAPGESVQVPVSYVPAATATGHQVTFQAAANSDNPANVSLEATFRGSSQPPNALVFVPPELVFDSLPVGQGQEKISVLQNVGSTPVMVTALAFAPQNPVEYTWRAAQPLPYTLPPGGSVAVYVDFQAQAAQASANALRASNDQPSGDVPTLAVRGESFIPPGGPHVEVVMGPEPDPDTGDCPCSANGDIPGANVDLSYRAPSGATCGKPQNVSCASGAAGCACSALSSYGTVSWGSARTEYVAGEQWVIDERVRHEGGQGDGNFVVRADLLDDCLAVPASQSPAAIWLCGVQMDCNNGPQACLDYVQYPNCEPYWDAAQYQSCFKRGPVKVRTSVRTYGGTNPEVTRHFCTTLAIRLDAPSLRAANVVVIQRQSGYFSVAEVLSGVVEVAEGQPCP